MRALGGTKCGVPLPKFSHIVTVTSFESLIALKSIIMGIEGYRPFVGALGASSLRPWLNPPLSIVIELFDLSTI